MDREKLREAIQHWDALHHGAREGGVSFIEGMRLLAGASEDLRHEEKLEAGRLWAHVEAGEAMREILAGLRNPARLESGDDGCGLHATRRSYQQQGVAWLRFLSELGLGACLADDMGLGKTIQVLALLLRQSPGDAAAPALLVVPVSLRSRPAARASI